jgi:pyridoxal 5'-phosphate synthase pdxT subunit
LRVGILSLQGAVEPHAEKLRALGAEVVEVRLPEHLVGIQGIILPGGESTAMIKLLHKNKLWEALASFVQTQPAWGVCAGAILLANRVASPEQDSLKALDITVERNAFGRQLDSFEADVQTTASWPKSKPLHSVFIRAPRIRDIGPDVQVLAKWQGEPVMVRSKRTLVSTFHPELTDSSQVHEYFLSLCEK